MEVSFALFLMAGALLLAVQSSNALDCYHCLDPYIAGSGYPTCDKRINVTCPARAKACLKWTASDETGSIVFRSCESFSNSTSGCLDGALLSLGFTQLRVPGKACWCDTDLCNSAESMQTSVMFLLAIAGASLLSVASMR